VGALKILAKAWFTASRRLSVSFAQTGKGNESRTAR